MKRALHTFAVGNAIVNEGAEFADDDPAVVSREELFEDVEGASKPAHRAPAKKVAAKKAAPAKPEA